MADDVQFLGEQEQVVQLLSAADVFILPSSQESFGLAALEAMACEVPVVASRVGGLPEVIEDGVTGFLHALDDLDGMAASVVRLVNDDALRRRVAEAARQSATSRFCDWRIIPAYESYYEEDPRPAVRNLRSPCELAQRPFAEPPEPAILQGIGIIQDSREQRR